MTSEAIFRQLRSFTPPVPIERARAAAERYGTDKHPATPNALALKAIEREARRQKVLAEQRKFRLWCQHNALPFPTFEHHFALPQRKFAFDVAWEPEKVALEINGGIWRKGGGAHQGKGHERDMVKLNLAQSLGWTVVQYTPQQVYGAQMLADLQRLAVARPAALRTRP